MVFRDFKDINRRTAADKILQDKAFNIAEDLKCDRYQKCLPSMVYKLFGKKTFSSGIKNENISNEIITFKKRKVHSPFMENVWGVDLEDM